MSLRKKLDAIKKLIVKDSNPYKKLENYDPDNPFPKYYKSYKKYPQPEPPKGSGRKRKKVGKRKKGGKRKKRGGKRKK